MKFVKNQYILFFVSILVMHFVVYKNLINNREGYFRYVLDNKVSGLENADSDNWEALLYDEDFLVNEESINGELSTGELFAIVDSTNELTVDVHNLDQGDNLPYASLLSDDGGYTVYDGRIIGWKSYNGYIIIYRKYIKEVLADNLDIFIWLWVVFFGMIVYDRWQSGKQEEVFVDDMFDINVLIREMSDNLHHGTLLASKQREILYVNKVFTRITGYHRIDVKEKVIEDILPENIRSKHESHFNKYAESETEKIPFRVVKIQDKRGNDITIELTFSKFTSRNGNDYFIAILKDDVPQ